MCDSSNNWSGPYIPQGTWPVSNPTNPVNEFNYKSLRSMLIQMAEMLAKHSGEIPEEFSSDEISVKYHNGRVDIMANFEMTTHVQQAQKRDIKPHGLNDEWPHHLFVYSDNSKDGVVNTFMTRPARLVVPILGKLGFLPVGDLDTSLKMCEHLNRFFEECLVDMLQEYSKSNKHLDGGLRFNTKEVDGIDGDDVRDDIVEYIVEHYGKNIKDYIERKQQ